MISRSLAFFGLGLVLFSSACGDKAVVDDVGITLNVKNADLSGNTLNTEKNISTEQGNPYGGFLDDIRAQLGNDPATITLEQATLSLTAGGTQANLEDLYTGDVTLS